MDQRNLPLRRSDVAFTARERVGMASGEFLDPFDDLRVVLRHASGAIERHVPMSPQASGSDVEKQTEEAVQAVSVWVADVAAPAIRRSLVAWWDNRRRASSSVAVNSDPEPCSPDAEIIELGLMREGRSSVA